MKNTFSENGKCKTKYQLKSRIGTKPPTPPPSLYSCPDNIQINDQFNPQIQKDSIRKNSNLTQPLQIPKIQSLQKTDEWSQVICPNCINQGIANYRHSHPINNFDYENNRELPPTFEDKYKTQSQAYIQNRINNRLNNSEKVSSVISSYQYTGKDKLINENENGENIWSKSNNRYWYDRAFKNQQNKENFANANKALYQKERPEISAYYNHYINNSNGNSLSIYNHTEENQKEKDEQLRQYHNDLLNQIKYRKSHQILLEENEAKEAKLQYDKMQQQIEKEMNEKYTQEQKDKKDLLNANLELINLKKQRKLKEMEDEEEYSKRCRERSEIMQHEDDWKEKKQRYNAQQQLKIGYENMEKEKERKRKERDEESAYSYNDPMNCKKCEEMGICCKCHRQFPRRLLSSYKNYY